MVMRRTILILTALLVVMTAAAGAQTPSPVPELPWAPKDHPPVPQDLLFWTLPALNGVQGGWVGLTVEFFADGVLVRREKVRVKLPPAGKAGVVQLLSRSPRERRALRGMAERGKVSVEVGFLVAGEEVDRIPLAQLLHTPPVTLEDTEFLPLRFEGGEQAAGGSTLHSVTSADVTTDCTARNACLSQCQDQYQDCLDSGVCFPQIICDTCDNERLACEQSCPPCETICTDPKSVTYRYSTQLIDFGPTGSWQCYEDPFEWDFYDGWWYSEYAWLYQQDKIQVTEYCNGSTSESVVGTSYFVSTCWSNTFLSCMYPFSWPPSTC